MSVSAPAHFSRDARRLIALTDALLQSGSQLEDAWWESRLAAQLDKILAGKAGRTVESVLEFLAEHAPEACDILSEAAETASESLTLTHDGQAYDALLFSAPILAWTRYQLPDGRLSAPQQQALLQAARDRVASPDARVVLLPHLVNFDTMPQSFQETRSLTQTLARAALNGDAPDPGIAPVPEPEGMLADTRFIIGVIVVPQGEAVFRWQAGDLDAGSQRPRLQREWATACAGILEPTFVGCQTRWLCPDAYFTNNREADHKIRPFVLRAAVTWLQTAANVSGKQLRAAIVGCGDSALQEYRIGFVQREDQRVIYGCIWPILSKEEAFSEVVESDVPTVIEQITAILKEEGVSEVRRLPGLAACENCEDCGAPYFPDTQGELHHPELPDETSLEPIQLH